MKSVQKDKKRALTEGDVGGLIPSNPKSVAINENDDPYNLVDVDKEVYRFVVCDTQNDDVTVQLPGANDAPDEEYRFKNASYGAGFNTVIVERKSGTDDTFDGVNVGSITIIDPNMVLGFKSVKDRTGGDYNWILF